MAMGWNTRSDSPRIAWVELLVLEPRLGQMLESPWWVELIVPGVGLDKRSRALEG